MTIVGPTYAFANRDSFLTLATKMVAQSFLVSGADRGLFDFTIELQKVGSPTGSIYLVAYSDVAGKPDSPLTNGQSAAKTAASISTSPTQYTFTFATPPFLANGATIHIVVVNDGVWDGSNYIQIGYDGSSPSFANGNVSTWAAGSLVWTTDTTKDIPFSSNYTDVAPAAPVSSVISLDWDCDCNTQLVQMRTILQTIETLKNTIEGGIRPIFEIFQSGIPGNGFWQSQWIQDGRSLPVGDGIDGLWYDEANNTFGGPYSSYGGNIYKSESEHPKHTLYRVIRESSRTREGLELNDTTYAGSNVGTIDFGTFTLDVPCNVIIRAYLWIQGLVQWTYFIDGTNVYQTEFSTAGALDSYGRASAAAWTAGGAIFNIKWEHYQPLAAGTHTMKIALVGQVPNSGYYSLATGQPSAAMPPAAWPGGTRFWNYLMLLNAES